MRCSVLICILILGVLRPEHAHAQDINFSQFYELPLLRNPALAGIFYGDIRITGGYRNQWQSVTTPYQTQALGAEFKTAISENSDDFLTFGLQLTNDQAGDSRLSKTQVLPAINFHKSVNGDKDTYISAGIMAGIVQHRFDPTKLQFDDQFVNGTYSSTNPTQQTFSSTNLTYWDFSAGLSFSSVIANEIRYYVGLGLFHFTKPRVAFIPSNDIKLNPKWVFNVGLTAPTGYNDRLIIYGDAFSQGGHFQFQGGLLYHHDLLAYDEGDKISIGAGAFYRWNDAVVPVLKLDYLNWGLGVSYDLNVSKLTKASKMQGGLELTLSYKAYLNMMNSSLNKVRCVQF